MTKRFQFITVSTVIMMCLSAILILQPISYSQDQASCPAFTVQLIQEAKQDFYESFQKIVSDATPASQNTTLAFDLYREYLTTLTTIFEDNARNVSNSENVLTPAETIACQQVILSEKQVVQETLQNILKASISGKQSFNLTEKYSQINQKFQDLNQQSNQVSKKIKDFSQQLPCYSQACVQD